MYFVYMNICLYIQQNRVHIILPICLNTVILIESETIKQIHTHTSQLNSPFV